MVKWPSGPPLNAQLITIQSDWRILWLSVKWPSGQSTFNGPHGLNTRDEIKARSRVNFNRPTQPGVWENLQNYVSKYYYSNLQKFTTHLQIKIYNTFTNPNLHHIYKTIYQVCNQNNLTLSVIIFSTAFPSN